MFPPSLSWSWWNGKSDSCIISLFLDNKWTYPPQIKTRKVECARREIKGHGWKSGRRVGRVREEAKVVVSLVTQSRFRYPLPTLDAVFSAMSFSVLPLPFSLLLPKMATAESSITPHTFRLLSLGVCSLHSRGVCPIQAFPTVFPYNQNSGDLWSCPAVPFVPSIFSTGLRIQFSFV